MDCAICQEEITNDHKQMKLSCIHTFHYNCLHAWIHTQDSENSMHNDKHRLDYYYEIKFTCPCCRKKFIFNSCPQPLFHFRSTSENICNIIILYSICLIAFFFYIFVLSVH